MKTLRGSLSFVLGIIVGISLFVTAIGGALVAVGMTVKVGKIQSSLTDAEIIDKDSKLYDSTLLDAAITLYDDIQNYDQLTMKKLYEDFGIKYVKEFGGIDFSNKDFYTLKLGDLLNDISVITNSFTLDDIGDLAGVNFDDYNIPLLSENSDLGISDLIDKLMSSFNGKISIRFIKDNFVPDLDLEGSSALQALQDITIDSFGSVLDGIPLRKFLDLDIDQYVKEGKNVVYVKTGRYEQISSTDLGNATYKPVFGVKTYIAGVDSSKNIIENELRYIKKVDSEGNVTYKVDNSSYDSDFDATANETTFYRYIDYEPYSTTHPGDGDYYVIAYGNHISTFSGVQYALEPIGFVNLNSLYKASDHTAYKADVVNGEVTIGDSKYKDATDAYISSSYYCVTDSPIEASSKLTEDATKTSGSSAHYVLAYKGETDAALQTLAFSSINSVSDSSLLDSYKLGDVITIDSSSSTVMQSLKDTKVSELGNAVDGLKIDQVLTIDDSSSQVLKSLKKKGVTVNQMSTAIDDLTIDEVIEINDSSSKLMKSLKARGTKVSELATIVDELFISEILDIYNEYAVNQITDLTSASNFILTPSKENGEYQMVDGKKITYTLDANGKYITSPIKFTEANTTQLGATETKYYKYTQIKTKLDATVKAASQNIYVYRSSNYVYNTVLTGYLVANSADDAAIEANELYYRETVSDTSKTAYIAYGGSNLYVNVAGIKIVYDKDNPAHADLVKYYLNESADGSYKYFVPLDEYRSVKIMSNGAGGLTYDAANTLSGLGETSLYVEATSKRFTRQFCENIYVKTTDIVDVYVFINNEYVAYDSANAVHQSLDRFKIVEGYYATKAESYDVWGALNATGIENIYGASIIREKSAPVLRTMASKNSKVNDLSSVLNTAKVKELMDLTPDNIFNDATIKESTINGISDSIKTVFNTMTIGELCDWANVTDVDAKVKSALNDVTMINFFKSLKYDQSKGIYVDMETLFLS